MIWKAVKEGGCHRIHNAVCIYIQLELSLTTLIYFGFKWGPNMWVGEPVIYKSSKSSTENILTTPSSKKSLLLPRHTQLGPNPRRCIKSPHHSHTPKHCLASSLFLSGTGRTRGQGDNAISHPQYLFQLSHKMQVRGFLSLEVVSLHSVVCSSIVQALTEIMFN